jgi:hypothetical protein
LGFEALNRPVAFVALVVARLNEGKGTKASEALHRWSEMRLE